MNKHEEERKPNTRYVKVMSFSVNDIKKVEKKVNSTVNALNGLGGKVISIVPHNFGITPMNMLYNIIYEADHAFSDTEITEQKNAEAVHEEDNTEKVKK